MRPALRHDANETMTRIYLIDHRTGYGEAFS